MKRVLEVDALRGTAILLMIVYHFFFDLRFLGLADINLWSPEWLVFQRIVGSLFIIIAGMSMTLSESRNKEGYAHHAKRGLKLAGVALLITAATWVYPHEGFIMFGIIHFLAAATLVAPLFFRLGIWNVVLGILVILAGFYVSDLRTDLPYLFWLGVIYPGYRPLDHYSIIPWFGIILLGIYAGQKLFPKGKTRLEEHPDWMRKLAFLGENSLAIYLIHQPVMIGLIMAYLFLAASSL